MQLLLKNRDKDLEESISKYESVKLKVSNIMKYQSLPRRWPLLRSTRSFSSRVFGIFSEPTYLKKLGILSISSGVRVCYKMSLR